MSAFTERARDKWESITPRERGLVLLLGIALPTVLVIFLGTRISDGLDRRETRIHRMRLALKTLENLRLRGADDAPADDIVAKIPTTPLGLETYVGDTIEKMKVTRPTITPGRVGNKDGFVTHTVGTDLHDIDIGQLKDILEALETGNKLVFVTALTVNRKFRDEDKGKLDVKLEVSTYSKEPAGSGSGSGGAGSGSS